MKHFLQDCLTYQDQRTLVWSHRHKSCVSETSPVRLSDLPGPENISLVPQTQVLWQWNIQDCLTYQDQRTLAWSHRHKISDNETFPARLSDLPGPESVSLVPQTQVLCQWNIPCKTVTFTSWVFVRLLQGTLICFRGLLVFEVNNVSITALAKTSAVNFNSQSTQRPKSSARHLSRFALRVL